ncbi:EAL domain-containing protein [Paucibacter soli]|uniref:EAL domain-containing protein n=1 Tax=Paucibacter soli TaxID=3133433 RepID=UPI00309E8585
MKAVSGFESKVLLAFACAVLVVAALVGSVWKLVEDEANAVQQMARGHELISTLARVRAHTLQVELATQSFRLSSDEAMIAERNASVAQRELLLQRIGLLIAGDEVQRGHLARLREVLEQRLAISYRVEQLRRSDGLAAATAYVATAPLPATRQRAYQLLSAMEDAEGGRLAWRGAGELLTHRNLLLSSAMLALFLLGLLAAIFVLIRRQLRATELARRQLADNEQSLATTLGSIGDAVLSADAQGRVIRLNPAAEALTGWGQAEALGRPLDEVYQTTDVSGQKRRHLLPATTAPPARLSGEALLLRRDASSCPVAETLTPLRDAAGRVLGAVLVFRDVSAERQARLSVEAQNERLELHVLERTAQLRESKDDLRSVIGNVPAMIAYVDAAQHYVYVNEQYRQRFAPQRADITGLSVREVLGEARYAIAGPRIARALAGEALSYDWQPFTDVWQVISYVPKRDDAGQVLGYYVLGTDITERKRSEARIQGLNSELALNVRALEHVSRALRTLSAGNRAMLRAGAEQELLDSMCVAIVEAGGYSMAVVWYRVDDAQRTLDPRAACGFASGLPGLRGLEASWADGERGRGAAARAVRSGATSLVRDMRGHPDYMAWQQQLGRQVSVLACPLRVGAEVIGALAIYGIEPDAFDTDEIRLLGESADDLAFGIATLRARAEQARIQAAMQQLTRYDALTGLPNETVFSDALVEAIHASEHSGRPFAVLQTDIDRLREVNDALGFAYGDQMLQEFGRRLRDATPEPAIVARLRGDEFAILLPDADHAAALWLMQQVEAMLATPCLVAGIPLDLASKTGIVLFPEHGSTPHDLLRHVDIAVHEARRQGLPHAFFDPGLHRDRPGRLNLAVQLKRAIQGDELRLFLQPKVEMRSGQVCGAEALLRWQHPERGLVGPAEFIPLAEETGLIKPLTEWVLAAVLRLLQQWSGAGRAWPVAVNLSARNLRDPGLLEHMRGLCQASACPPGLLEIEITESTVMEDAEHALHVLHGLREQGIALYVDDFGTGYSSLSYLQKLPVDFIKIDQSFVRALGRDKDAAVIVKSTIDLVHELGRQIVAEGIETSEALDLLAGWGCDVAQGYLIARPMPADEFPAWVAQFRWPRAG